jgi:hypothetical protein
MLDDFVKYILGEWRMIAQAPVSFSVAVLVAGAIIWWAMSWGYGRETSLLSQRVADYQDKLKGASPDQAANEIARLSAEIDSLKSPPRDDNSVYQKGKRIGAVAGVKIDAQNKVVTFGTVTIGGELDEATNVEFRDLILSFIKSDAVGQVRTGLAATTTYQNAKFSIVGNR